LLNNNIGITTWYSWIDTGPGFSGFRKKSGSEAINTGKISYLITKRRKET